jgi:16S rRNA (guanine527-N7)-methyltransferase
MEKKFDKYAALLREWNQKMNLVAPGTIADMKTRHFDDSAQLAKFLPPGALVYDLGSGAGFPGVVLAIMGFTVVCIESIAKKAVFLSELKKELDLPNLTILNSRVEEIVKKTAFPTKTVVFTARAFAPLERIFDLVYPKKLPNSRVFAKKEAPGGFAGGFLLLKGRAVMDEITAAEKKYDFSYKLTPSETGDGFILEIHNLKPRLFHVK